MTVDKDEHLMAVLLGEPAPRAAADAAGHAAAERDMADVRAQLHRIGDGLARAAAAPVESPAGSSQLAAAANPGGPAAGESTAEPAPRDRRPRRKGLFVLAACVALAALGTGGAYLAAHAGNSGDGSEARLTDEALLACSTAVAEGTVAGVEPLGGTDRFKVMLDVERSYKPESGPSRLTFTAEGAETPTYYRPGAKMLVVVSRFPSEGPLTFRAGDPVPQNEEALRAGDDLDWGRRWVERALPGSHGQQCPGAG